MTNSPPLLNPVLILLDGTQDVDVIYIGTPHSHHYKCAHDALSAGKAVLCEKSLTVNAAQAKALVALARAKNLFFMEAVRTHSTIRAVTPWTDESTTRSGFVSNPSRTKCKRSSRAE